MFLLTIFLHLLLTMLSVPSGWGLTYGARSCYYVYIIIYMYIYIYDLIDKGHVPLHSTIICIDKECGHRASSYSYIQD